MNNRPTILTTLPFTGFYDSIHSDAIDREIEDLLPPLPSPPSANNEMFDLLINPNFYRDAYEAYAKAYATTLGYMLFPEGLGLPITYVRMDRPRFYNFETDVLIAEISVPALVHAILQTDRRTLEDTFADLFTSRSGFHSFYDPNPENLPFDFQDWDENQVGAILQAYTKERGEDAEELIVAALAENGDLQNLVWEALPQELQTLIDELYDEERRNENDD